MIAFDLAYQMTLGAVCKRTKGGAVLSAIYTAIAVVAAISWPQWQSMGTGIDPLSQAIALSIAYALGTLVRPIYCAIAWPIFLLWFARFRPLDVPSELMLFLIASAVINGIAFFTGRPRAKAQETPAPDR